ncbi:MAG: hypothetical protein AAGD05_08415 [Bacteroidota bacterium]
MTESSFNVQCPIPGFEENFYLSVYNVFHDESFHFLVGLLCFLAACSSRSDSEMEILEGEALYHDLIGTWQLDYLFETYRDTIFANRTEASMTCTFFEDRTLLPKDSLNRIFNSSMKLN